MSYLRKLSFNLHTKIFSFLCVTAAVFLSTSDASNTCPGIDLAKIKAKNAYLHPSNCSLKQVPVGTACYVVCNKGYGYKQNSHVMTECSRYSARHTDWTVFRSYLYETDCKPLTKCPVLDSFNGNNWWGPSCNVHKSSVGTSCKTQFCPYWHEIGVKEKVCQQNGTWTPVGGAYCKTDPLPHSILCQNSLNANTSPGKATADISSKLLNPVTNAPESEIRIIITGGKDITAMKEGKNELKYTIYNFPTRVTKHCTVYVRVKDKEPPSVLKCPDEIQYTVATGLKTKITIKDNDFQMIDAVDSDYKPHHDSSGTAYSGKIVSAGNWLVVYRLRDSSANEAFCRIKIRVKSKRCTIPPLYLNGDITASSDNTGYISKCPNGTRSMCFAWHGLQHQFDLRGCNFNFPGYQNGVKCGRFVLEKPLPSCVNESEIFKPVNGSCPNGTAASLFSFNTCFPCERGMFFNSTSRHCQLCPDNSTTYTLGALSCVECPKHQMTKLRFAPRLCEDICEPGFWLDSSNQTCTQCPRGSFAGSGARTCTKCPNGLTTLESGSSDISYCVAGHVVNRNSGSGTISPMNISASNAQSYRYQINLVNVSNKVNQMMAFKFDSSFLNSSYLELSNCSQGYVRVLVAVNSIEFELSDKICGSALSKPVFVGVKTGHGAIVEFFFNQTSNAKLSFVYGIANCLLGEFFDFVTLQCKKCPVGTYRKQHDIHHCLPCSAGTTAPQEGAIGCIDICPKGTIRVGSTCKNCPIGYYQDEPIEKTMCKKCPNGTVTSRSRTTNISDCVVPCGPGEFKSGNFCSPCPPGLYQDKPMHADRMCYFCPYGTTTVNKGSTSNSSCVSICSYEGEYYDNTEGKCKKCPVGTYKLASEQQVTACTPCATNHTTNRIGAASITECVDTYDHCSPNPCKFPGWCEDIGDNFKCHCPYMFSGKYCENRTHVCESRPCQNNGTCHNHYVGWKSYYCECPNGYTGLNCETGFHPCTHTGNPCYYNANCSEIGNDFFCHCPPWHTGKRCEGAISKPCYSYPCRNRAVCINGASHDSIPRYTCNCSLGYTGKNCETNIDDCVNNTCNTTGTLACLDRINGYRCHCKYGFTSPTCNQTYGCQPGEYTDNYNQCVKCPIGEYHPHHGYLSSCTKCPDGKSTLTRGAKSESECVGCGVGEYYDRKCIKCEKGTYQSNVGYYTACIRCPNEKTTYKIGSRSLSDCHDPKELTTLKANLRITSESWSNELTNKSSTRYNSVKSKFEKAIGDIYANETTFLFAVVDGFSQGSIICNFSVYFTYDAKNVEEQLTTEVQKGSFGGFTVDTASLKIVKTEGKENKEVKKEKKRNYTLMAVLIVVGVLVVMAAVVGYLVHSRHRNKVRVKFDKMMAGDTVSVEFPLSEK